MPDEQKTESSLPTTEYPPRISNLEPISLLFRHWLDSIPFSLLAQKYSLPQNLNGLICSWIYQAFSELQLLCYSWINSISNHLSLSHFASIYRLTAIMGRVTIRVEHSFKMCTWKPGLPIKTKWDTYFYWHVKTSKRLQDSKITSLKDSLQKANKKLSTQWYLQLKTIGLICSYYSLPSSFTWVLTV